MTALDLATEHAVEFEAYRQWPYPDPASQLARATQGKRWGFLPPREVLALLPPATAELSGAPWTNGYGQTGKHIGPDTGPISERVARVGLQSRLEDHLQMLKRMKPGLTMGQYAALAGFYDNVGPGRAGTKDGLFVLRNGRQSKLWTYVLADQHQAAADAFLGWTRAQGMVMAGLLRRRKAERSLYLRGP